jgi:hypothetical protein
MLGAAAIGDRVQTKPVRSPQLIHFTVTLIYHQDADPCSANSGSIALSGINNVDR